MALPVKVDVNVDVKGEEDSPTNLGNNRWPFAAMGNGGSRFRSLGVASDS